MDHLDSVIPMVREQRLGLVVDFDGTISEIAPTPDDATISPGCAVALKNLSHKLSLVALVSGRSVDDLKAKARLEHVLYVGSHGAEYLDGDQLTVAPGAAAYSGRIQATFDHLKATVDPCGLVWQDKELSASVHYRQAPDTDQARRMLMEAVDSAPGAEELEIFWGKFVLELRSPLALNKGYAIRKLARDRDLKGVIFLGDDTTDLDAISALRQLAAQESLRGLGVAVQHEDSPEALLVAADYGLTGVEEVERFLGWLNGVAG